ncbi:hypothetical protein [Lyngbya sp. CCY1209]|uniref:hypothetical protein n=1 Tax=Lyngbya sp. CCY1209 TaxID=2886103 RepID=UPI002D20E4BD|nr:hypothetical protein [Lyngbya sp. CCY1209]MEB3882396.1 hypothetical protein [Lyngbya sp. CCY1209]
MKKDNNKENQKQTKALFTELSQEESSTVNGGHYHPRYCYYDSYYKPTYYYHASSYKPRYCYY